MALLSSAIGLLILLIRFAPILKPRPQSRFADSRSNTCADRVSIIVPARNEEANLPTLLSSLAELDHPRFEVILVDDESEDRTREVAERFAKDHPGFELKVVAGQPKPPGWSGKNWACHQGFLQSTGRYLLFTDADTEHFPSSLRIALEKAERGSLDLLSAAPVHRCETWWEKTSGPFQLFLLLSTAAFSKPRVGRFFAIGQYLLFRRDSYEKQGGHAAIHDRLCDDLELARRCLEKGGKYRVEGRAPLFRVRMYATIKDFLNGWRRNFRLGFRHASIASTIEIYFVIALLTANMKFAAASSGVLALLSVGAAIFALVQSRFGNFSFLGIVLLPLNVLLFVVVTVLALFDLLGQRGYSWRGRRYQGATD